MDDNIINRSDSIHYYTNLQYIILKENENITAGVKHKCQGPLRSNYKNMWRLFYYNQTRNKVVF